MKKSLSGIDELSENKAVPVDLSKTLNFLDALGFEKSKSKIIEMLSERLGEEGILDYHYCNQAYRPSNTAHSYTLQVNKKDDEQLTKILAKELSTRELTTPITLNDPNSAGSYLIVPVFGPYFRSGAFILRTAQSAENHLHSNIHLLDIMLQKTHAAISLIDAQNDSDLVELTRRETDVLACVSSGFSNQETANLLGISIHTVNGYLRRIMLKFGTKDRLTTALVGLSTPKVLLRSRKIIYDQSIGV